MYFQIAGALCGCYMVAWTPYSVVGFHAAFLPNSYIDPLVTAVPCVFAKCFAVCNPIIYFLMVKRFRDDAMELIHLRAHKWKLIAKSGNCSPPSAHNQTNSVVTQTTYIMPLGTSKKELVHVK